MTGARTPRNILISLPNAGWPEKRRGQDKAVWFNKRRSHRGFHGIRPTPVTAKFDR